MCGPGSNSPQCDIWQLLVYKMCYFICTLFETQEDAIMSTKPGGTIVILGLPEAEAQVKFYPGYLIIDRTIKGSALGGIHFI